jgi:hypothetical protein
MCISTIPSIDPYDLHDRRDIPDAGSPTVLE